MNKPTEEGFYWLYQNGDVTMIKVYGFNCDDPTVCFLGSDWDKDLCDVEGEFIGPIIPPKRGEDIISEMERLSKEFEPKIKNPLSFPPMLNGSPVYEVKPLMVPIIQVSKDFKWLTDEARAKINRKLRELIGCREQCAIPKDSVLMWNNSIFARPEHISMINGLNTQA